MDDLRTLTWTAAAPTEVPPPALPPRYQLGALLGRGGMGTVWAARDTVLERDVAVKVLHDAADADALIREARAAARLEHPALLPVHDVLHLDDGRLAFTMRLVRGQTLAARAPSLPLRRRIDALRRVAEAVAFAHAAGLVHRDLKPANVLLGPFGEVWVVDWGLSAGDSRAGTPGYAAPEQRAGGPVGPPADVWALGATLAALLTGRPPDAAPIDGPAALVELASACLATDPSDRPPEAGPVAAALARWLDGDLARERALAHVARAGVLRRDGEAARAEADDVAARAEAVGRSLRPEDPIERKRPWWALQDAAAAAARAADRLDAEHERALHAALAELPDLPEARAGLAVRAIARVEAALARGEHAAADRLAEEVRTWDPAWFARFTTEPAHLALTAQPAGTELALWGFEAVDRRLVPVPLRPLGPAPIATALEPGSFIAVLSAPGRATVRLPIAVRRGETWTAHVDLPPADDPDTCWVPAGPCVLGGDPAAPNSGPRTRLWVDGFGLRRHPVTNAEFAAFLNALEAEGEAERALAWVPRIEITGNPVYARRGGRWIPGVDDQGHAWHPDLPVLCVTWEAAMAYAAWRARVDGIPWRLPGDLEWEKAARGVDGRAFPWGDHFEPAWANTRWTDAARPLPAPIHAFPTDESPYGVRGLAGNALDWVLDDLDLAAWPAPGARVPPPTPAAGPWRAYRGGAWGLNEADCRAAGRTRNRADHRSSLIGFRLARPWPCS